MSQATTTSSTKEGTTSSKTVRRTKGKVATAAIGPTRTGTQMNYQKKEQEQEQIQEQEQQHE